VFPRERRRAKQKGKKENTSMMKKLVGNVVSVFMEVLMWITFIGCSVGGLYFGYDAAKLIGAVGGLVLGAIVGICLNTGWWLISAIQEIRNYLKEIAERQ
jgi:hypothetical protein